ncbi:hypothetical protein BJY52DRAFT_109761 [Lactarius psammicola]|nr:hypothetical protein BJY52DRAFT_109761 [Lactarius psammicola]
MQRDQDATTRRQYQSSSMSIAMVPSGPSAAWMALAPTALPANRLRLRMYSLCLTCFFALINTSLPRLALFAPAYERLAVAPMLDRARGVRTTPAPLALAGIFEPPRATAERERDDVVDEEDPAAAARCAPSLAIMREREIRGFRACCGCCCPPVTGLVGDARLGLGGGSPEAARTAAAAAASEVGRTGGGTASSGVVNILLAPATAELAFPLPPRGLLVIASRAELRGGVLARCATMLLVLDLATAPVVAVGLRVFARELAVGANSLDVAVALLGLNMLAAASLLPSAAVFVAPGPLLVVPGAARRCEPADNEFVAVERERPTLPLVPMDEALLAEPASTLRRELVDAAGVGFKGLAAVLLDKLADREFVGPFLLDRESNVELGGLERDDSVPVVVGTLLDADTVRVEAILLRPTASDGRDAGRDGFLKSPGFAFLGSAAIPAVCDLVGAVVVVVVVREAFAGEPALKFHTLRTIDLAEERNPKRGFALALSVRWVAH